MRKTVTALITAAALCVAAFAFAESHAGVDIVVLGEVHDNPFHHATQLDWLREVAPTAVVYEMLLPGEAAALHATARNAEAIKAATQGFHWQNIADYSDLLAASPVILGAALPRDQVRRAFSEGAAAVLGSGGAAFGLTTALPPDQLAARMDQQFAAHCEAMPRDMMGGMVEAQRLRDAAFARAVLTALDEHGAPVVLITGNGHARKDWGVPALLAQARPDLIVFSLGQTEEGAALQGTYDLIADAPRPDRDDPCRAFKLLAGGPLSP